MALGSPPSPGPGETNVVLESWSFDNNTNGLWASDSGYFPLSFTNVSSSDLGRGTALVVDSTNAAWMRYHCNESDGHTNISVSQGTFMMWFAPTSWAGTNEPGGTGPGTWARLLEVGQYTTNASYGWFSLYLDPAGTHLYFSSQTNNGSEATYFSAPVDFAANRWHHLAVVYDNTNSSLYIDGQCVTNGPALSYWPGPAALTNGFTIGSDATGTLQARGMIDDVVTYANPLDAGSIEGEFFAGELYYLLNPMNDANLSSAPSYPTNSPTFQAINGSGYLQLVGAATNCTSSPDIWFTNVVIWPTNNGTVNVTFTIAGGSNDYYYDVFAISALPNPLTNGQWYWMGQGQHCNRYTLTNLPSTSAFLMLGKPTDSDGDGLTDAYELLVSHTDPNNPDTFDLGMSDGWQIAYLGYLGADPYTLCPGDGWTYLQAAQNGWNPTDFHTPPAPTGLTASYVNGVATVSWDPSPGPVLEYIIQRDIPSLASTTVYFTNLVGTTFHQDNPFPAPVPDLEWDAPTYEVSAVYGGGLSSSSQVALYGSPDDAPFWRPGADYGTAAFVRGPLGGLKIVWSGAPTNVAAVGLQREKYQWPVGAVFTNWSISMALFTNGVYSIPDGALPAPQPIADSWCLRVTNTTGIQVVTVNSYYVSSIPFFDGREQMKENLSFMFRAANEGAALAFTWQEPSVWSDVYSCPTNYAYAGFYDMGTATLSPAPPLGAHEYGPFTYNAQFRNFVFATTNDLQVNGSPGNGVVPETGITYLDSPSAYEFVPPTNSTTIPSLLPPDVANWVFVPTYPADIGITTAGGDYLMSSSAKNIYGLPFLAAKLAWGNEDIYTLVLTNGGTIPYSNGTFYAQAAQPDLQTVDYYFTQVPYNFPSSPALTPLPGQPSFSVANTSPLLIAAEGDPSFRVAGYAKQALLNGHTNTFGYLGQYFDFLVNSNGVVTTTNGILSPYGDFFPTQPGPVGLVTMPDIDTGQRGTGIVNVIKLQLDMNHDGFMDTSFAGPDNTSPEHPFLFWLNNNFDRLKLDKEDQVPYDDDVSSTSPEARSLSTGHFTPDYDYTGSGTNRVISCMRDLQDFARLWVCGATSNLLGALPPGTTVSLSWGDVGAPNYANPTIDIFPAADTDGGIGYLTNQDAAVLQTALPYLGRLSPGQSLQLNASRFANNWAGNYFIWCGVSNGIGELTLSIAQGGTNVLAQTSAYIQLKDVKQMYERWTVGDRPWVPPTNSPAWALDGLTEVFHYAQPAATNTPYILFVHGWNLEPWEKDRFAESAFKRLYWQGYQGRFGLFRWPTYWGFSGFWSLLKDRRNYDNSEFNAWSSGIGLVYLLDNLQSTYPGNVYLLAHSMGNVVAGEALRHEGTHQVVNTYVATQAAIPAHLFDEAVTNSIFNGSTGDPKTPNIYTNYFASILGDAADRVINFYNTNDYALQSGRWELDQVLKPDQSITLLGANYSFTGYPYNGQPNYSPGSVDDVPPWLYFVKDTYSGRTVFDLNVLPDRQEVMAYAAQPRSTALGRTAEPLNNLSLSVDLGRTSPRIWPSDAQNPNSPYGEHFYHSAQFRGDYWQQAGYWSELLGVQAFRLK